jgi:hypothetical protein
LVFKDDEGKDKAPANAGADASNTAQPKSWDGRMKCWTILYDMGDSR